jgi:hypothetical protein
MAKQSWDRPKRVVIPAVCRGGKLLPLYGGEMPAFVEGAVADIVVETVAFADAADISRFNIEEQIPIVTSGSRLLAVMRRRPGTASSRHAVAVGKADPLLPERSDLIPFTLEQDLVLHFRGTKHAELEDCDCRLDTLAGKTVKSVNEAYMRLSEHYEPHRRSHAGNVFDTVYVLRGDTAVSLNRLREAATADFEKKLFHRSGTLPLEGRVREEA